MQVRTVSGWEQTLLLGLQRETAGSALPEGEVVQCDTCHLLYRGQQPGSSSDLTQEEPGTVEQGASDRQRVHRCHWAHSVTADAYAASSAASTASKQAPQAPAGVCSPPGCNARYIRRQWRCA